MRSNYFGTHNSFLALCGAKEKVDMNSFKFMHQQLNKLSEQEAFIRKAPSDGGIRLFQKFPLN